MSSWISWVKCQEFGFICSVTMSSGWNEVSHSLSNISNCQEKNVTFQYTWFSGMSIVYWLCSLYKELDYKSQKILYNVIFQLTGAVTFLLFCEFSQGKSSHFKGYSHEKQKGKRPPHADWTLGSSCSSEHVMLTNRRLLGLKVTSVWAVLDTFLHYWQWTFFLWAQFR